ncbi:DNA mismatch endonuclease Vsr [Rhodococcus tukisamuensis]|uniref:DNA mismatch endonuclease, patch repair protein n=1 Tax=Rhodococcus tukisamuensis TaxID=168276 RepID=A0A1G6SB12_9NOCA|nr:DNA mismatch endonuclease Vsr [Rhodococcus tukisamuensis]SDD13923.1 DNA mismatch endonuclease, patch repair protein [Rhodococcus tukisamuensis]
MAVPDHEPTADHEPASTPVPASASVRARMREQRRRDTAPELALRRELHRRGRRYRVDRAPLPGLRRRADLVFPTARVAVFVDGCFWHCCPVHGTRPKNNASWWAAKLDTNVARDRDTDTRLADAGWRVVRVWEHEDSVTAADAVDRVLDGAP